MPGPGPGIDAMSSTIILGSKTHLSLSSQRSFCALLSQFTGELRANWKFGNTYLITVPAPPVTTCVNQNVPDILH